MLIALPTADQLAWMISRALTISVPEHGQIKEVQTQSTYWESTRDGSTIDP